MKNETKPIRIDSYCSRGTIFLIFSVVTLMVVLISFSFLTSFEEVLGIEGTPCKGDWDCPWNAHCDGDFMKVDEYECTNETCENIGTDTLKDCREDDYRYCAENNEDIWERIHTCLIENDEPCCRENDDIFIESCEGACVEDGDDAYCMNPPDVTTKEVTGVTSTNATLQGELTNMGGADSVDVWFQWDTDDTLSDPHSGGNDTLSELGTFNHTISAEGGITYYFRAVAENDAGTAKGEIKSFTTFSEISVTTNEGELKEMEEFQGIQLMGGKWELINEPVEIGIFTREVTVEEIDEEGEEFKVTANVTWQPLRGGEDSVTLTEHLTNWQEPFALDVGLPVTENLALHLDADAIEGLNDNDSVTQWNDLSGNNNNFDNTANENPIFKTDQINNLPAVDFDGNKNLYTNISALNNTDPYTVIFVGVNGGGNEYGGVSRHDSWNHGNHLVGWQTTAINTDGTRASNDNSLGDHFIRTDINRTGDKEVDLYNNGVFYHTLTYTSWAARSWWGLGSRAASDHQYNGMMAEVLVYDTILSVSDREAVEQYLGNKWGITLE